MAIGARDNLNANSQSNAVIICHSEERSDEESHFQREFLEANRDSPRHRPAGAVSLPLVAHIAPMPFGGMTYP